MTINFNFIKNTNFFKNPNFFNNTNFFKTIPYFKPILIFIFSFIILSYIAAYLYGIIKIIPLLEQVFLLTYLFITLIYLNDVKLFDYILIKYHHLIPIWIILIKIYFMIPTYLSYNLFLLLDLAVLFEDNYMVMMNPGNNPWDWYFGAGPSGSNNFGGAGGSSGPGGPGGPGGLNNAYPAVSNSGNSNNSEQATVPPSVTVTAPAPGPSTATAANLAPVVYDPSGTVPPSNTRELYRLIRHRVDYQINVRGLSNVTVTTIFARDDIVNRIAKEMLFAYIFDHRQQLPTAYRALNLPDGPIRWHYVIVNHGSPLMKVLRRNP